MMMSIRACVFSCFLAVGVLGGRSPPPSYMWVAKIRSRADCLEVGAMIQQMCTEERRNRDVTDPLVIDADDMITTAPMSVMRSSYDCFVSFESDSEEFVHNHIATLPDVEVVSSDNMVFASEGPRSWGLDRVDQPDLPLDGQPFDSGYSGSGHTVYILDTGVNQAHVDFTGRANAGVDFTGEGVGDSNGHGTHCAGTAVGASLGVARGANVVSVKVLGATGTGSVSGVIQGVQWAVDNSGPRTAVISMSLGGGMSAALDSAVESASNAGNIVVVAAGNSGTNACTESPARTGGTAKEHGGVISVGATTSADRFAGYSNYGVCVDILAPGSHITSAVHSSLTGVRNISGTSMATPHVAGVLATLLDKNQGSKAAAMRDLFSLGVPDRIKNVPEYTPNLLVQTDTYVGPPTPPTLKPTFSPTYTPAVLCAYTKKSKKACIEVIHSKFGPALITLGYLSGPLVMLESEFCTFEDGEQRYDGAVLVVLRGGCFFYDKVLAGQLAGAKAVLIQTTSRFDAIFAPIYLGGGTVGIHSGMIAYKDAKEWRDEGYETAEWGNDQLPVFSPVPLPTMRPTRAPSPRPTSPAPTPFPTRKPCHNLLLERKCRNRNDCIWRRNPGNDRKRECIPKGNTAFPTPSPSSG